MADRFCLFLDFRSPTTTPFILPFNHFYSSALHSHISRIRIRKTPHHLTLLSASSSSSHFDVISTHEHSDGSVLFRFGDPNEVAKNVTKEEIEGEGEDVVKDSILKKKADGEVEDLTNSILSSSSISAVVEGESESSENLLESSSDTEVPVLTSIGETEDVSTSNVEAEYIEDVKEGLNEEYEDSSSPAESSTFDEGSIVESDDAKVEMDTNTQGLLEKEITEEPSIIEPNIGVPDNGILEASLGTALIPISEHKNVETEMQIETSEDDRESFDCRLESSPPQSEPAMILSKEIEEQNLQAEMQNVAVGEGSKSDMNDIVDLEMQSLMSNGNASDASDAEANSPTLEDKASVAGSGTLDEPSVELLSEKDTIQLVTVPPPLEADSVREEEIGIGNVEESSEDNGFDIQKVGGYPVEASVHKATVNEYTPISKSDMNDIKDLEMQNVMDNGNASDTSDAEATFPTIEENAVEAGSGKDMIQLMTMQSEADSVGEVETGVVSIEGSREYDDPKDLKVSGDLVEASVHEATVTESTPMSHEMLITDSESDEEVQTTSPQQDVQVLTTSAEEVPSTSDLQTRTAKFVLSSGAALLLHPSKVLTGGEDAYFVFGQTWLGVADGVGLWSFRGTNTGVYAQELMKNCERLVSVKNGDSINNPLELLNLSVAETDSPGSSTVLITQLDGQALHVANVGDSGFIVLRNGAIHKRSSPMNHAYYLPMQIKRGDDPSSLAELYRVDVEEGDVIITATDGLFDNLYDQEISLIVMKSLAADKKLQEIAKKLALKAQEIGRSVSVRTPFGDDARAAGFVGYTGGKLDDVAVIVSLVQRR